MYYILVIIPLKYIPGELEFDEAWSERINPRITISEAVVTHKRCLMEF